MLNMKQGCLIAVLVGLAALVVSVSVILAVTLTGGDKKLDCSKDEFHSVSFKDSGGKDQYLKFLAFGKSKFENLNFQEAVDICPTKNAKLWEVQNKEEWLAIMEKLKDEQKDDIWLNGKMEESCPREGAEVWIVILLFLPSARQRSCRRRLRMTFLTPRPSPPLPSRLY
jgi:hypothetical protein